MADGPDLPLLFRSSGCGECGHTGYQGRLALLELLRFDTALEEAVARGVTGRELLETAKANGYETMVEYGIRRIREGATSENEVSRVLDLNDRVA